MKYDIPEILRTSEEKVFPKKGGAYDRLSFPLLAEIPKGKNKKYDRALYRATRELYKYVNLRHGMYSQRQTNENMRLLQPRNCA